MSVKLVMLKSGEDIITDVKELKSEEGIVGYYFHNPLIVQISHPEKPTVLNEDSSSREYESKISVQFYPWIPLSEESRIPCSADWVVTIVEPVKNIKKLYQERLDGRHKGNQSPLIVQSGDSSIGD
jgi:hypothetical protein|tara:strand:- start:165 stop:542 length:378 start_codon:yes stop_codon:yes gene_type:complete